LYGTFKIINEITGAHLLPIKFTQKQKIIHNDHSYNDIKKNVYRPMIKPNEYTNMLLDKYLIDVMISDFKFKFSNNSAFCDLMDCFDIDNILFKKNNYSNYVGLSNSITVSTIDTKYGCEFMNIVYKYFVCYDLYKISLRKIFNSFDKIFVYQSI